MKTADRVSVTTVVAVDPLTAFSIFTEEIDAWWKPKVRHLFRKDRTGVMKFEPGHRGFCSKCMPMPGRAVRSGPY
jgi:hypothetical protein